MVANLQTDPPDFGKAKRVPRWWLNWAVLKRRKKAAALINSSHRYDNITEGVISIVILSCQRLPQLKRLVHCLEPFLRNYENNVPIEKVLVDNGSGTELLDWARNTDFFDLIVAHEENLGMAIALDDAFLKVRGEYILLLEDDFVIDYAKPFLKRCVDLFNEFPEIGIIRLKNQRNWGKPFRVIGPLRTTAEGTEFWTWLPSLNGKLNVWTAGSVIFRKISFLDTGSIPHGANVSRSSPNHQGILYEEVFGKRYNRNWLAAKIKNVYPFVQPSDHPESPGWAETSDTI